MDGRSEAHMDVLVAFFGKRPSLPLTPSSQATASTNAEASTVTEVQGKLRPNFSQLETRIHHEHQIRQVDPPDVRTTRHDRTLRSRPSSGKRKGPRHLLRHLKLRLRRTLQQRIQNLLQRPQRHRRPKELR